jgi:hypothetical protein
MISKRASRICGCRSRTKLTFGTLARRGSLAQVVLRRVRASSTRNLNREYEEQSLRWHRHPNRAFPENLRHHTP